MTSTFIKKFTIFFRSGRNTGKCLKEKIVLPLSLQCGACMQWVESVMEAMGQLYVRIDSSGCNLIVFISCLFGPS